MELRNAIGDTLRNIRQSKGLSLRQVSSVAHVAIGHISDVETGAKNASTETLECLAKGLGVSSAFLIGEIYEYLKDQEVHSAF